jgi:hypothetical protein
MMRPLKCAIALVETIKRRGLAIRATFIELIEHLQMGWNGVMSAINLNMFEISIECEENRFVHARPWVATAMR